jgi:hypothetical protein
LKLEEKEDKMSYTPDVNDLNPNEDTLSQATSAVSLAKESMLESEVSTPAMERKESVFEPTVTQEVEKKVVQPQVSEKYADESERRLAEFVIAKEMERALTNGAAAREVRDAQIAGLVTESDKVRKATL